MLLCLSYLLALVFTMSLAISNSDNESRSSRDEVGFFPETQVGSTEVRCGDGSDTHRPCRSSHVTGKRLAGWPVHRIVEELYACGVTVLASLSHEELFDFLLIQDVSAGFQELGAGDVAGSPPNSKGKATPHPAPASPRPELAVPSKRPRQSVPGPSTDASILSSLLEVKSPLSIMNARLNSLENNAVASSSHVNNPGPSSASLGMPAFPALPATSRRKDPWELQFQLRPWAPDFCPLVLPFLIP